MKNVLHTLVLGLSLLGIVSCEDVIEVEVPSEPPRLIIDALIRIDTTQPFTLARIKVSQTNSFFETVVPAGLQQITLFNLDLNAGDVLLEEVPGSGIYSKEISTEALMSGAEYFLQIDFNDEFFVAYATFQPTVPIDNIVQGEGTLFDEDETEIIVSFTDNGERDDFYLFDFDRGNFLVTEDEFYQGQQFSFSWFYDEDINVGDELDISIMGVDEDFAVYMDKLIEQSEGPFGPFETPSITVRGNIINATTIDNETNFDNTNTTDNFALGYFAIVQEFKRTIVIE
ncbi:MAG: DUF4249 family protein [Bacteroidota bacterium]